MAQNAGLKVGVFGYMERGRPSGDVKIGSCSGEEERYVSNLAFHELWAFCATSYVLVYQALISDVGSLFKCLQKNFGVLVWLV